MRTVVGSNAMRVEAGSAEVPSACTVRLYTDFRCLEAAVDHGPVEVGGLNRSRARGGFDQAAAGG